MIDNLYNWLEEMVLAGIRQVVCWHVDWSDRNLNFDTDYRLGRDWLGIGSRWLGNVGEKQLISRDHLIELRRCLLATKIPEWIK
jgi:hypothetical protein